LQNHLYIKIYSCYPLRIFPWRVIFFIFGSEILNSCPFIVESIFMRTLTVLLSIEQQRSGSEWRIYNERNDNRRKVPAHNKGSGRVFQHRGKENAPTCGGKPRCVLGLQRKSVSHKPHKIRGISLQYFYDLILFILPLVVAIFTIKSNI